MQPAAAREDGGGEVFLQGRFHPRAAVAALMQRGTGEIEAQGGVVIVQMQMDADVRVFRVHVRALVELRAEAVGNRVLDFQARVLRVRCVRRTPRHFNRKGFSHIKQAAPVHRHGGVVERGVAIHGHIGRRRVRVIRNFAQWEIQQRQQDARGEPRPQAGAVGGGQVSGEADAAIAFLAGAGAEGGQFSGQQRFNAAAAGGE